VEVKREKRIKLPDDVLAKFLGSDEIRELHESGPRFRVSPSYKQDRIFRLRVRLMLLNPRTRDTKIRTALKRIFRRLNASQRSLSPS